MKIQNFKEENEELNNEIRILTGAGNLRAAKTSYLIKRLKKIRTNQKNIRHREKNSYMSSWVHMAVWSTFNQTVHSML